MGTAISGIGNAPALQTAVAAYLTSEERTLAWMARKAGVSVSHLYRVTTGERPLTAALAEKLAELMGVPVNTLSEPIE